MKNVLVTTTYNRATNSRVQNITEGKATDVVFNAFRKLERQGTNGRISGLDGGMHCDFEYVSGGVYNVFLMSCAGDVLATAIVDEFDR